MADKALNLYNGLVAQPAVEMWLSLFTTSPTADHPTAHGGVEWGPARTQIFANGDVLGPPNWSVPSDLTSTVRYIANEGSVQWINVTLTTSPSTVLAVGVWDASSGGNLLTWDTLENSAIVTDAEDRVFGTNDLKITGD